MNDKGHRPLAGGNGPGGSRASRGDALALDLGSSSVRGILELFRVGHEVIKRDGHLVWDIDSIMAGVREGLDHATEVLGQPPASIGVDAWGVDYGLIDHSGHLLRPPRAYRDTRMAKYAAEVDRRLPPRAAWEWTGIQPQEINTAYQVFADLAEQPRLRQTVHTLLPIADLAAYLLGATPGIGRGIGSSTGLAIPGASQWSAQVLNALDIPHEWLPHLVSDSTVAGTTDDGSAIVRCGGHDTACAVHSLGLGRDDVRLFLSCGSWNLVGVTIPEALITAEAYDAGLTNEVRTDGGIRFLRNLTGLWLLQECQRYWRQGDIVRLLSEAWGSPSLGVVVDPDDESFVRPGEMPAKLAWWCRNTMGSSLVTVARWSVWSWSPWHAPTPISPSVLNESWVPRLTRRLRSWPWEVESKTACSWLPRHRPVDVPSSRARWRQAAWATSCASSRRRWPSNPAGAPTSSLLRSNPNPLNPVIRHPSTPCGNASTRCVQQDDRQVRRHGRWDLPDGHVGGLVVTPPNNQKK